MSIAAEHLHPAAGILEVAERICQRVGILHRGRLAAEVDTRARSADAEPLVDVFRRVVGVDDEVIRRYVRYQVERERREDESFSGFLRQSQVRSIPEAHSTALDHTIGPCCAGELPKGSVLSISCTGLVRHHRGSSGVHRVGA